jgi:hypothetical protein
MQMGERDGGAARYRDFSEMPDGQLRSLPIPFRDLLLSIARTAKPALAEAAE